VLLPVCRHPLRLPVMPLQCLRRVRLHWQPEASSKARLSAGGTNLNHCQAEWHAAALLLLGPGRARAGPGVSPRISRSPPFKVTRLLLAVLLVEAGVQAGKCPCCSGTQNLSAARAQAARTLAAPSSTQAASAGRH
jgi:hypothetical protein